MSYEDENMNISPDSMESKLDETGNISSEAHNKRPKTYKKNYPIIDAVLKDEKTIHHSNQDYNLDCHAHGFFYYHFYNANRKNINCKFKIRSNDNINFQMMKSHSQACLDDNNKKPDQKFSLIRERILKIINEQTMKLTPKNITDFLKEEFEPNQIAMNILKN